MGLFDKLASTVGGAIGNAMGGSTGGQSGGDSAGKREEIRNIFDSRVKDGTTYTVLAGMNMVTTKKLTKEIRTYFNYLVGYKDGDDPEIVLISTVNDLSSVDEPVICKKSECTKAVYVQNTGSFSIAHPQLGNAPVDFSIISSAAWGAPGSGALIIPVSYLDEYTPFTEFFQNRFAK
ncbi:MAG: hypothetical protein LBM00_05260 [Deltaproteobacteria bacterium]|jgi:hypothetical protein|nr:hypothetical protein [Deltaproteobacteria bacterium]